MTTQCRWISHCCAFYGKVRKCHFQWIAFCENVYVERVNGLKVSTLVGCKLSIRRGEWTATTLLTTSLRVLVQNISQRLVGWGQFPWCSLVLYIYIILYNSYCDGGAKSMFFFIKENMIFFKSPSRGADADSCSTNLNNYEPTKQQTKRL